MPAEETSPSLSPEHTQMLAASAISPEVADARGYRTIRRAAELKSCGFGEAQRQTPTLLVPIYNVNGEIALYHHRPDRPRIRDGKPAKYEFPAGSRMAVDVHPSLREKVRDPSVPLLVTEGVKKADAAVSAGLCAVAVIGTWNWRGTNEWGGKTALPDWDSIAFKDKNDAPRQVYIVYDSDVMLKVQVYAALARLSAFLKQRGAAVAYIYLPHGADGRKVGLDDYLAAGHSSQDLLTLASPVLREPPKDAAGNEVQESSLPYAETPQGLVWRRPTAGGPIDVPLCNFTARIVADVTEDDGAETRRLLEMEARRSGGCARFSVPAACFAAMNWPLEQLGAAAILYPGQSIRENARVAIQTLSGEVPKREVYAHTGWRQIGGRWAYLHAGDALGLAGEPKAAIVRLPAALERFRLPEPPTGDALRDALRASLALWDRLPEPVALPLLAAVYRAALGTCDFSLHLTGPSGAFKSEAAALAQQHFGAGMDARHLPGSWTSTDNALEGLAFAVKDGIIVLDDFAPTGTAQDAQRLHAKADRVLRGQGNNAGRGRMNADGTLRVTKYPRGLIVSTGEDVPLGLSLRARLLVVEIAPGSIGADALTACQRDAAAGLYAQAMSGYLAAIAADYEAVQERNRVLLLHLRDEAATYGGHRRTPEIIANLALGLHHFLRIAHQAGAISGAERENFWTRAKIAFRAAATAQAGLQAVSDPAHRYLELLAAAIASGRAHLAGPDGDAPLSPEAWGWRAVTIGVADNERTEWRPQGERVGWRESAEIYLQPDAAYSAARRQGETGGDGLVLAPRTLHKRLHEGGLLAGTDGGRGTLTVRKVLGGQRRDVLHLRADKLHGEEKPQEKEMS